MSMTSVDCCPLFRSLKKSFLAQIRSYMTFCPHSKAVLILLQNGTCYRYGEFKFELSPRAKTQKFLRPSPFQITNVVGMAHGFSHILLLNDLGQIWSFGHNPQGQLGQNNKQDVSTFDPKLIASPHKFVSIRCGSNHSLALTENGKVFAWGSNSCCQIGVKLSRITHYNENYQTSLYQVCELNSHRVIAIECGWEHSLALTEQGEVYVWGMNKNGQLGFPYNEIKGDQPSKTRYCHPPTRLDNNVGPVKCIAAGREHTLLLTQCGQVYACGGNNPDVCLRQLTKMPGLPFISQIFAHSMSNISIAIAPDRSCYIWTSIDKTSMIPRKLPSLYSTAIDSIFAMFLSQPHIPYSISFEGSKLTRLGDRLSRMFDNRDTNPDIQFLVEDNTIHAHRCILRTASSYFNRLFSEKPTDSKSSLNPIPITDYSYSIFHSYLRFIYTGVLPKLTSKSILKFLQISLSFEDNQLQYYCLTRVFNAFSEKNWLEYFEFSDRHQLSHLQITLADWIITDYGPTIFTSKRFLSLSVTLQEKLKKLIKNADIISECEFVVSKSKSKPNDSDEDTDSEPETDLNSESSEFNPDSYPLYVPRIGTVSDSDSDDHRWYHDYDSDGSYNAYDPDDYYYDNYDDESDYSFD